MKTALMWSGGKDSASALYKLRRQGLEVTTLITTMFVNLNKNNSEPIVEGTSVPLSLMKLQAQSVGCELIPIIFNDPSEFNMDSIIDVLRVKLSKDIIYGSGGYGKNFQAINWHIELWNKLGITPLQTIDHYTNNGKDAADDILQSNIKAKVMSINLKYLPIELHGSEYDTNFIQALSNINPDLSPVASQNEFQTFCYDSPDFTFPIKWTHDGQFIKQTNFATDYLNFMHTFYKNIKPFY